MRSVLRVLLTTVAVLLVCPQAHATLIKWTLNDVALGDGGTASGFFIVDTGKIVVQDGGYETTQPVDFYIKTTAYPYPPRSGFFFGEREYSPAEYSEDGEAWVSNRTFHWNDYYWNYLTFTIGPDDPDVDLLHTTQGTVWIDFGREGWDEPHCCSAARIIYGTLSATVVPEPSALAFIALGMGVLVGIRLRRSALAVPSTPSIAST